MNRLLVTMLLVFAAFQVGAADMGAMFGQGRSHFSLVAGNGHAFNSNYVVVGASASYFVDDGLGVGFSYESWSGGARGITKYAPFAQYVFYQGTLIQPYIGGFYRHTAINGLPDINSVGGRAGFYFSSGPNASVSAGLVYESYLDCQETVYRVCRVTYPDISLTFGF